MKYRSYEQGMTLLEVLVALTIFILMAGAGYSGLQQGLAIQDGLQQKRQYWRRLDTIMILLQQDFDQARNLSQRIPVNAVRPFVGASEPNPAAQGELVSFTRGGHASYSAGLVSPHLRVAYRLREGSLYRTTWPRLNMPESEQGTEAELIDKVTDIQLRFLDTTRQWNASWPTILATDQAAGLPLAVQLTLTLGSQQTYERVFNVGAAN